MLLCIQLTSDLAFRNEDRSCPITLWRIQLSESAASSVLFNCMWMEICYRFGGG